MGNRILNGTPTAEERRFYMDLLNFALEHPAATESAKHEAKQFIKHQNEPAGSCTFRPDRTNPVLRRWDDRHREHLLKREGEKLHRKGAGAKNTLRWQGIA